MTKVESILEQFNVPYVQPRKYWLVRTDSGSHYEDFTLNSYIALGWDYITEDILNAKNEEEVKALILAQEKISPTADEDENEDGSTKGITSRVTAIYNKLKRFIKEISVGDVVIIPSRFTNQITIGIVESPVHETANYAEKYLQENPTTEITPCPYLKRRAVNWVKTIRKGKIDVYLLKAFSSHQALTDISNYKDYINREIYSIYQADGMIHSTIRAGHPNGMSFQELRDLLDILEDTFVESSKISGIEYDARKLQMKLNIHSPGLIEIAGAMLSGGALIAIVMFAWNNIKNGSTTKFNLKIGDKVQVSAESESLGIEGRRNEKLKIENDFKVQVLQLAKGEELKRLSVALDIDVPEVKTVDDALTIPADDCHDDA